MTYDVTANNKTGHPKAFYALYIGPSNNSTSHIVFKLSTKKVVTTTKFILKSKSMAEDIITIEDEIERK